MKVLTLIIACMIFGLSSLISQEQTKSKIPTGKDFMFEIDFTPFTGDQIIKIEQFRGRYYFNEHWAVRVGVTFDHKKEQSALRGDELVVNEEDNYGSAFDSNSKVAPYVGAEFIYQFKNSEENEVSKYFDSWDNTIRVDESNVDGAWEHYYYNGNYYVFEYTERAYNRFGANVFAGVDFYFVRNFYFGFELGAGFQSTKYKDVNIDEIMSIYASNGTLLTTDTYDNVIQGYSKFSTGFYVINAIRIGAWF